MKVNFHSSYLGSKLVRMLLLMALFFPMSQASALTAIEFSNICKTVEGECSQHPILNAYVGGALDLIASLQEQDLTATKVYCKEPKEIFNVPRIISYMDEHSHLRAKQNAMVLLINYFEEFGGCE